MVELILTTGEKAIVDSSDYESLNSHRWRRSRNRPDGQIYPHAIIGGQHVRMHRFLMNPPPGMQVDHINGNTLDNRRSNLRIGTHAQNKGNTRKQKSRRGNSKLSSQFKGVFREIGGKWVAQIGSRPRQHLGTFSKEEDAAKAYDVAAVEKYGEFASVNFPPEGGCAWCNEEMGIQTRGSHGICKRHFDVVMSELESSIKGKS